MVVDAVLRALRPRAASTPQPLRLLDLGVGSGCIAVTLACELPACVVVGVELSWVALHTAQHNLRRHGVASRVRLVHGRWTEAVRGTFDGIVSNPPYVPSSQVDGLPLDVRREPRLSLDGGMDGQDALRHLLNAAPLLLGPGGLLALECGEDQAEPLARLAETMPGVHRVEVVPDLTTRPRGLLLRRAERRAV